jgi:hypothetical protein
MKSPCAFAPLKNLLKYFFPAYPKKHSLEIRLGGIFPLMTLYQQMEGVLMLQSPSIF